jgi:hypothetical protein
MRSRRPPTDELWESTAPLKHPLSVAKLFIWVSGAALGLFLVSFQIRKISAGVLVSRLDHDFLVEGALILYLNCWVWAQPIEMGITKTVYAVDPYKGRIPISLKFLLPGLIACAAILFISRHDDRYLSWALTAFFTIDFFVWRNFASLSAKYQKASEEFYEERRWYWRIEQLRHYAAVYMRGKWQLVRFSALLVMLLVFLAVANFPFLRLVLATLIQPIVKEDTVEHVASVLPGATFLCYVLVCEGWVWFMRLRAYHTINVIEYLGPKYELHPRPKNEKRGG